MMKQIFSLIFITLSLTNSLTATELVKTVDKESQLIGWKFSQGNFQLELIQRSPEQTRSFFQGRGFSAKVANDIATSCVLQTIGRNTQADNNEPVSISLKEWKFINSSGEEKTLKLKETWNSEWGKGEISTPARIAFRWATFPTTQSFDPGGDFNWGMISIGPKPGAKFDLQLSWKQGDTQHSTWIKQMECPSDQ